MLQAALRVISKINGTPTSDSNAWHMNAGQVVSSINNLIIGKIYVDHGGTMRIHSSHSNLVCKLKFKEQGVLRMREAHEVDTLYSLCYCSAKFGVLCMRSHIHWLFLASAHSRLLLAIKSTSFALEKTSLRVLH